jgi:hypothetical protein
MLVAAAVMICASTVVFGQIRPPGYDREMKAMEERMRTSILDQDSVTMIDTVFLYDPVTSEETVRVVSSTVSWRDYLMFRLGVNQPDRILDGQPMTIRDPQTYEDLTIRWNATETKVDTLR